MERALSAQKLLSGLAKAGLPRLTVAIDWHRPVWVGRARPRRMLDGQAGPEYRRTQSEKWIRRLKRRSQSGKEMPSA